MSKRLEELRKGCGHIILKEYNNCGQDNITKDRIKPYCDKCQARIDEREKMEKEVKDILNEFARTWEIGQEMENSSESCGECGCEWISFEHSVILKEIKKKLGLSEDTKQ